MNALRYRFEVLSGQTGEELNPWLQGHAMRRGHGRVREDHATAEEAMAAGRALVEAAGWTGGVHVVACDRGPNWGMLANGSLEATEVTQ